MVGGHNVFHVSHLRKYVHDLSLIIEPSAQEDLEIKPNLTVVRHPVYIVDQDEKMLRNNMVKLIKIRWSEDPWDCTWETMDHKREAYPELMLGYLVVA